MGYSMPIVCKELYIPIPTTLESLTLTEYKDKYGIDLSNYIVLNEGYISLEFPLYTKVFLVSYAKNTSISNVAFPNKEGEQQYVSGSFDGILELYVTNDEYGYGLHLEISQDDEFDINNLKVQSYEI